MRPFYKPSPRLLPMKNYNFLLLLLGICFTLNVGAQNREFVWTETPTLVPIPAEFQNNDAVITYHKQRYAVDEKYDLYYTVHTRVRILTAKGLEEHARIMLPKYTKFTSVVTLDARTIKKNGTVVDLKQEDIKKLDLPIDDFNDMAELMVFSIPGAEVGDEVEMLFIIKNAGFSSTIFLQQHLPTLKSTYEMRLPKMLFMDIVSYNGMVKPLVIEKNDFTNYTWQMENLPSYGDDHLGIKTLTIPYIYQIFQAPEFSMLNFGIVADQLKWSDILKAWKDEVVVKDKINVKYDNFYKNYIDKATQGISKQDSVQKIIAIHNALNQSLEINNSLGRENLPLPAFLEKGEIAYFDLICLYIKILENQYVPYSIVFSKSKYEGPFDFSLADISQIDYISFAVKDGNGNMHLITPRTSSTTYCAGELPLNVHGTAAIVVHGDDLTEGSITLPTIEGQSNFRSRKIQATVNLTNGTIKKTVKESMQGSYSLFVRGSYISANNDNKLKDYLEYLTRERDLYDVIDSISISGPALEFPFDFKLNYELTQDKAVSQFEDGLYQLNFSNWFYHNTEELSEQERTLTYYPVTGRKDQFKYYLVFDKKVELVNADNLKVQVVHPEHGAYELTVKQVNPTVILLESNYVISGNEFAPTDMAKLKEINDAWEQASQTPLLFKVL